MAGADDAVSLVELVDERRHLLDVALWMLGSGREAERVIDEAYRQWFGLPEAERTRILEPRSWLCRAVGGACLSRLASPGQCGAGADAVGGVLVDSSSPADRARRSLRGRPTSMEEHDAVVRAVREACAREDERQLASLLTADTAAFFDGGGKVRALVRPVEGKMPVARSLLTLLARHPRTALDTHAVNGRTGLVVRYGRQVAAVISLDVVGPHVVQVWVTLNPDKLRTWNHTVGP
ncbi:RNA polymerase subunit sigma [Streptomyces chartreusis]|uniref:RNA polymerase subunit sigma n=1 Tax=Streptomyces chartreusis TaxID=1969 RepID=UPI0033E03E37|nr:RNA polymerase subunit sigma [Streptomyces chartreusis]WTA31907.1 RNA polymerase subunit sigma [Streptomyces chartreusis]